MMARIFLLGGLCLYLAAAGGQARAEDMATLSVEMKDGTILPGRLEAPAGTAFKLEIRNGGSSPAELESTALHREKVVAAGGSSFMVFRRLSPGEYRFFDDFHPQGDGMVLVVK